MFAFVNLNRNLSRSDTFAVPAALADLAGIWGNRTYNVKNIAAYLGRFNEQPDRRNVFLWPGAGRSGADIRNNGVFVSLNPVPSSNATWTTAPYEAQFLKLYDVTPPPAPSSPPSVEPWALDGTVTFTWSPVNDPAGLSPVYVLTVTRSDGTVQTHQTSGTSFTVSGLPAGVTATATVRAVNPNDGQAGSSTSGASQSTYSLTSSGDEDGDGQSNAVEVTAGTNPLDSSSLFRVTSITPGPGGTLITWDAVPGRTYSVEVSENLQPGSWQVLASGLTTGSDTDTTSPMPDRRFYRVRVSR